MNNIVTVCTPTYNRAHLLHRVFDSLKKQTCKDFTWLIIDDGSTDNTKQVVSEFKKNADFPIEYHTKKNGGRHTALNYSYKYIKTIYVINIDSDDELAPNAISDIIKIYNSFTSEQKKNYWQISGRCIDQNGNFVGKKYPSNINQLNKKSKLKKFYRCSGEKSNCRRVEVLKKYPFPVYNDTKFVTENTVWEKIDREYESFYTNDIFRVYFTDSSDSLAKGKMHSDTRMNSRFYYSVFCINELFDEIFYNKNVLISIINIARSAICTKKKFSFVMKNINKWYKRAIVTLFGYPLGFIYIILKKETRGKMK